MFNITKNPSILLSLSNSKKLLNLNQTKLVNTINSTEMFLSTNLINPFPVFIVSVETDQKSHQKNPLR